MLDDDIFELVWVDVWNVFGFDWIGLVLVGDTFGKFDLILNTIVG